MKVAIVWENGVSKWVSQMFEPLMDIPDVDVTVFVGQRNKYDVKEVLLKKEFLCRREEILLGAGRFFELLRGGIPPYRKMHFYRWSLEKRLAGFDVVECYDSSRALHTLAEIKDKLGFKLIVNYWENIPYRQVFDDRTNHIKRAAYGKVDHFIPFCDTIKRTMLLEGVPEERLTTIYPALDLRLFKPEAKSEALMKEYGIQRDEFIISYIGKLASWKGVHMLPYAAKILISKGYGKFRVLITGRGAQLENLKKVINEAGVSDYFCFTGFLPYERIRELHNLADVLALPSYPTMTWQEQFGMVLAEAMACGKPVVASASGSIPEVVGDAGLLFTPGDFFGFAEKIAVLMDDAPLRKGLGEKARRRVETNFDAKKNALKIYEVYKKALGRQP